MWSVDDSDGFYCGIFCAMLILDVVLYDTCGYTWYLINLRLRKLTIWYWW